MHTPHPHSPWLTLAAVCLAALAMPLSFTGPAVALSAIHLSLGGSAFALSWISNAFMLCFGSSLLVNGALADRYGRKRVFLAGTLVCAVASLAISFSSSLVMLNLLRGLQGLAASAALASGIAALAQRFDGPGAPLAFSLVGTSFGIGLAFGPLLAGFTVLHYGWRGVFGGITALTLLAWLLASTTMSESRATQQHPLDVRGAVMFSAALAMLTLGILLIPQWGIASPTVLLCLACAVVLFGVFARHELRSPQPLLDIRLFRLPRFVGVQFLAAAPAYGFVVLLILLPIRLVGIEGMDALATGRLMMALSAPMVILPLVAAWLTRWFSAALLCGIGLLATAIGLLWLSRLGSYADAPSCWKALLVIGSGISLPWGLMDGLAVSVAPKEQAGMAAGMFSTTRVAGEGIAIALTGALLAVLITTHLPEHPAAAQAASDLAMGKLYDAAPRLPTLSVARLQLACFQAFQTLLQWLSAITVVTAVLVAGLLGHRHNASASLAVDNARG